MTENKEKLQEKNEKDDAVKAKALEEEAKVEALIKAQDEFEDKVIMRDINDNIERFEKTSMMLSDMEAYIFNSNNNNDYFTDYYDEF